MNHETMNHESMTHETMPASQHADPSAHSQHAEHGGHINHSGHELLFRNRFWICLLLTIPVLLYSQMVQMWFGFTMPNSIKNSLISLTFVASCFPASAWGVL